MKSGDWNLRTDGTQKMEDDRWTVDSGQTPKLEWTPIPIPPLAVSGSTESRGKDSPTKTSTVEMYAGCSEKKSKPRC